MVIMTGKFQQMCYGNTNMNPDTGVHYGVISENSIDEGLLEDIYTYGSQDAYDEAYAELKAEGKTEDEIQDELDCADFGESSITYDHGDYKIQLFPGYGVYILKSPVVVKCRPCSPCSPNAGDLDNLDEENGIPCYGLLPEDLRSDEE
jgi:hypothetical protein